MVSKGRLFRIMSNQKHIFPKLGTVDNYRHLWMLSVWVVYLILYLVAEHVIVSDYHVMHIPLDEKIPFCEWMIIPYCLWHPFLVVMSAYLMLWDAESFKRFMAFIGLGFIPVIIFDMIFPNGQDLRPAVFEHTNIATRLVAQIYAADTNTNVFPSMHVIGSAALAAAAIYTPSLRKRHLHWIMIPLGVLISVSTVFVKQHSCLDLFGAIPYSALIWWLVYGVIFKRKK